MRDRMRMIQADQANRCFATRPRVRRLARKSFRDQAIVHVRLDCSAEDAYWTSASSRLPTAALLGLKPRSASADGLED